MGFLKKIGVALMMVAAPLVAVVEPSDLSYLGSFDVTCGEEWCTYGQRGLEIADGGTALWITGREYETQVVKISIPPVGGTAQKLSGPTNFINTCPSSPAPNWFFAAIEESGGVMRGFCQYWYNVSAYDIDNYYGSPGANAQHVGPSGDPHSAKTGGYLFEVPADFASQHLGGRRLITGFHRESGSNGGSQGPTLIAFDADDPASALDLVWYREYYPECNWDEPYSACDLPGYRTADRWEGASWVRSAAGDAILIAGRKGLGDNYYGPGRGAQDCTLGQGYHSSPYEAWILFYDPQDIVDRLQGAKEPWEVLPYDHLKLTGTGGFSDCSQPGGMTFDQASGKLYVANPGHAGNGQAKIHVWQVGAGPPPPTAVRGGVLSGGSVGGGL